MRVGPLLVSAHVPRSRGVAAAVCTATAMRLPTAQSTTTVLRYSKEALQCGARGYPEAAGVPGWAGGGDGGEAGDCARRPGGFDRQVGVMMLPHVRAEDIRAKYGASCSFKLLQA